MLFESSEYHQYTLIGLKPEHARKLKLNLIFGVRTCDRKRKALGGAPDDWRI
jgi:hypothetical protein